MTPCGPSRAGLPAGRGPPSPKISSLLPDPPARGARCGRRTLGRWVPRWDVWAPHGNSPRDRLAGTAVWQRWWPGAERCPEPGGQQQSPGVGGSAEHAAPPGSPPALAPAGGTEGGAAGHRKDVPDVLLVPGRALQVGHGVDLPGHGLSLGGAGGSDPPGDPGSPITPCSGTSPPRPVGGWHLPAGRRWAPGVPPAASAAPPGPAAGRSCSPPAAPGHPCRSGSPPGTTVGGTHVTWGTGTGVRRQPQLHATSHGEDTRGRDSPPGAALPSLGCCQSCWGW